jgi:hypothetical protein
MWADVLPVIHTYYNPPTDIREIGRRVEGSDFAELSGNLCEGEVLFELLHRPDHVYYAVLLNGPETFDDFKKLSANHPFTPVGYFAVPWSDAEDGTDELPENWLKP